MTPSTTEPTAVDEETAAAPEASEPRRRRPRWQLVVAVLAAVFLVEATGVWIGSQLHDDSPGEHSVEAGFSRDMSVHHAQAVEMAEAVRASTTDPAIRTLAVDIDLTQQAQIGQMRGWLDVWGLPPTGRDLAMAWMGEPTSGLMPGMAGADELKRLHASTGTSGDVLFLQLMIRHHQGGVAMAQAVGPKARPEVRRLAAAIVTAQQSEIDAMTTMLKARGAEPLAPPKQDSGDESMPGMGHG